MKLNVAIFSIWFSVGMPSFVMGQGATERADSVPTRYEKMMARRMEGWKRLIPDHYKIQFAGSIGAASIGTGWTYGKKQQWETDVMLGFLPKFESEHHKAVFTLKQSYLPWRLRVKGSAWVIQPLSCSLFLSSVLSDKFWTHEPDRYPKDITVSQLVSVPICPWANVSCMTYRMFPIGGYKIYPCIMN